MTDAFVTPDVVMNTLAKAWGDGMRLRALTVVVAVALVATCMRLYDRHARRKYQARKEGHALLF